MSASTTIYQSANLPGYDKNHNPAQDLQTNDNSLQDLYNIKESLGESALNYDLYTFKSHLNGLASLGTKDDPTMYPVLQDMFNHFLDGTGTDYRNSTLTQKVFNHPSTQTYISLTKSDILAAIRRNGGNISKLPNDTTLDNAMQSKTRPVFDTSADTFNGLGLAVHATWGLNIKIKNYSFDGNVFSGTLRYTIYDHFGLSASDILSNRNAIYGAFNSWYILQHYTAFNGAYRPFITYFEADIPFSGQI